MPILPLRDVVVYPHMVIPLFVGREKSINALKQALNSEFDKKILLVVQKISTVDNPAADDLYRVGTVATILQLLELPDGTVKVLVEGLFRGTIQSFLSHEPYFVGQIEVQENPEKIEKPIEALLRLVIVQFENYIKLNKKMPLEILSTFTGIEDPVRLIDNIASHMVLKISEKQNILEISDIKARMETLLGLLETEISFLQTDKNIRLEVKNQMAKNQREYYLNEQMKAIQKELGDIGQDTVNEIEVLTKKIKKAGMTKEAQEKALSEVNKLKMMSPMSAEATVCRNYIDSLLSLPWKKQSKIQENLHVAETTLHADHYGLEKVKERILEYLAVQQRVKVLKGPILCLVGPPGVGKTSLGQSIARATGREFVRMSLGGVRDEAEIRGHRRTYIGALMGKILQKLAKVKVNNPLFLLDEIDKIGMDFRGDPASALLEVLDPEQNKTFNDHYLEIDYDLSNVLFIATANSLNIPPALLDRMEVIRLAGYTEAEKVNIVKQYLIPKQLQNHGLKISELAFTDEAIVEIIRYYTREAGVRNLEREIAKLCRKRVKELLLTKSVNIPEKSKSKAKSKLPSSPAVLLVINIEKYLGVRKFRFGQAEDYDQVGQVTGLAWTEVGGEILTIEAMSMPGKGKITSTGKLGEVMQESIQAAMTVVRSRASVLGLEKDFYEKCDIHIHVPEGATPKDGPSAGIGMCTALVSILTGIPVRKEVAMTGEITLRGQVLPIGGLKEKLLAARRAGILKVIIPKHNERELREITADIYQGMQILPVQWIDEVLEIALVSKPTKLESGKNIVNPKVIKRNKPSVIKTSSKRHH